MEENPYKSPVATEPLRSNARETSRGCFVSLFIGFCLLLAADFTFCAIAMSRVIIQNQEVGDLRIARLLGWAMGAILLFVAAGGAWRHRWPLAIVACILGMLASAVPAFLYWQRLALD
jgi:hypothetical protein